MGVTVSANIETDKNPNSIVNKTIYRNLTSILDEYATAFVSMQSNLKQIAGVHVSKIINELFENMVAAFYGDKYGENSNFNDVLALMKGRLHLLSTYISILAKHKAISLGVAASISQTIGNTQEAIDKWKVYTASRKSEKIEKN